MPGAMMMEMQDAPGERSGERAKRSNPSLTG
jgi:hypothetical protein